MSACSCICHGACCRGCCSAGRTFAVDDNDDDGDDEYGGAGEEKRSEDMEGAGEALGEVRPGRREAENDERETDTGAGVSGVALLAAARWLLLL